MKLEKNTCRNGFNSCNYKQIKNKDAERYKNKICGKVDADLTDNFAKEHLNSKMSGKAKDNLITKKMRGLLFFLILKEEY